MINKKEKETEEDKESRKDEEGRTRSMIRNTKKGNKLGIFRRKAKRNIEEKNGRSSIHIREDG